MRKRIELTDSMEDIICEMSEGNPGGLIVLMQLMTRDPLIFLHLDDMNIRGTQIWIGFKDCCKKNIDLFIKLINSRDENLVKGINIKASRQGTRDKAVTGGASCERDASKLEFTDEEMKKLAEEDMQAIEYEEEQQGRI